MKKFMVAVLLVTNFWPIFALAEDQIIDLQVTEKGFEPSSITVKPGASVTLKVTRKTDATCATRLKIPSKNITRDLPLNKDVNIALGRVQKGEIRFSCGMDMITGVLIVN